MRTFALFLIIGLSGCKFIQRDPDIAIDGWWDVDYAKNACESMAANAARFGVGLGVMPCVGDPSEMAYGVERDFLSAFQENPACAGVSIVNDFHGPNKDGASTKIATAQWQLMFDVGLKDGELSQGDSGWTMVERVKPYRITNGYLGSYFRAATDVCTIVKGGGGKVQ